jgi:hypothetical protein
MAFDFYFPTSNTGIVFLSLKYHYANPVYLNSRVADLRTSGELARSKLALLCVVMDREDPNDYLVPLQMLRFEAGLQTILVKGAKQFGALLKAVSKQAERQAVSN